MRGQKRVAIRDRLVKSCTKESAVVRGKAFRYVLETRRSGFQDRLKAAVIGFDIYMGAASQPIAHYMIKIIHEFVMEENGSEVGQLGATNSVGGCNDGLDGTAVAEKGVLGEKIFGTEKKVSKTTV